MSLQLGILLQMSTRDYLVQQIMVNEVIYTRKASIDQFIDDLCVLRFFELVNFPLVFEPLFLASKANTPGIEDVLSLLQFSPDCSSDKDQETFSMLKDFVKSLNSEVQQTHYIFSNYFVVNQSSIAIFTRLSKLPAVLHWFKSPSPHWI